MDEHSPDTEKNIDLQPSTKQVLLFLGATIFLCMVLGSGIIALACELQGVDFEDAVHAFGVDSSGEARNFMRGALLINHLLSFMVPALLTGWVFYRQKWARMLGVYFAPNGRLLLLGIAWMIAAFPLAQWVFMANRWLIEKMPWMHSLVEAESASEKLMEGLLVMPSVPELAFSLLVMAVVPAIGEELVFRGLVQKTLQERFDQPYKAILVSAMVFSLAHFQVQRFFAILLLGLVLGLLFYWTRNLWISIAGHFVVNGTQVVVAFFMQDDLAALDAAEEQSFPVYLTLAAAFALFFIGKKLSAVKQPDPW